MENTRGREGFCPVCQQAASQPPTANGEVVFCSTHQVEARVEYLLGEHRELPDLRGMGRGGRKSERRRQAVAAANVIANKEDK